MQMTQIITNVNYSTDFFTYIVEQSVKTDGNIKLNDEVWSYKKVEVNGFTTISYVNTTGDFRILNNTLTTYIIIFAISILVTGILSAFLTRKAIAPVKESFEKQKQFVSDASHELKTPLTVINTNVDILLTEDQSNNKWLHYIKSEVERMSKLTKDLLYLSNMSEMEKKNILKSKINISEKVESITLGFEAVIFENELSLIQKIQPNLFVEFNLEQLHQVIVILIDNAIKYTQKHGTITISLSEQNNNVYLKVQNTGAGIKEEHINHIFDRFYKVDKSRQSKSNSFGLGLPIAKTICENHSVKLHVNTPPLN